MSDHPLADNKKLPKKLSLHFHISFKNFYNLLKDCNNDLRLKTLEPFSLINDKEGMKKRK